MRARSPAGSSRAMTFPRFMRTSRLQYSASSM